MNFRTATLGTMALIFAGQSSAYDWEDNQHGCLVENARYAQTDSSLSGVWKNSPKSFFVNVRNCATFAAEMNAIAKEAFGFGVGPEASREVKTELQWQMDKVESCEDQGTAFIDLHFSVDVDGLPINYMEAVTSHELREYPYGSSAGLIKFDDDSHINFSKFGQTADEEDAWFFLHARCTVLKP